LLAARTGVRRRCAGGLRTRLIVVGTGHPRDERSIGGEDVVSGRGRRALGAGGPEDAANR
jgi:hypothetical protein